MSATPKFLELVQFAKESNLRLNVGTEAPILNISASGASYVLIESLVLGNVILFGFVFILSECNKVCFIIRSCLHIIL